MYTGGMPPTPQAVQIAGQKQNQQQYDPSKGPPVQNAASLHTPPPQLPGRMPQGGLPITGLPLALSQQAQLVEPAQAGGHLQAQVKVPAGGSGLATVNPHTQIQAQLQQQMQPALHLQLQPQQQQSQAVLQSGQAVRLREESALFKVFVPHISNAASFPLFSLQTVALARPTVESNPPVQRIVTNSIPMTTMPPGPLSVPNSVPASHVTSPLRTAANVNHSTQSKLTGSNGLSAVKSGGFGQNPGVQATQEGCQDRQIEQAKLVSSLGTFGSWLSFCSSSVSFFFVLFCF